MMLAPARRNPRKAPVARIMPLPFPTKGWNAKLPLASMPQDFAVELRNWFPQPGYGEVRRGYRRWAWSMGADVPVQTLMAWRGPASSKLFAVAGTTIWEVTLQQAATSSDTGWTLSRCQHVNHTTSAGHFLFVVNGQDAPKHYNGTAWAAPTITGVTPEDIVHVNSHKKRLWFTIVDSTTAYYLATEAVAGAATAFALGSLFTRGGYLMAMATWTRDGGSGSDDYAVFISSEGQIALYQGTDPSSANTWALVGTFDVPPPIGRRCFFKYGADLGLITVEGVFPLSQLLSVDQSQSQRVAMTDDITPAFATAFQSYGSNFGWEACVYPKGTRLIVNIPTAENSTAKQYVMNTVTGAWCEFDAHHANCWIVFGDNLYFGGNNGSVFQADSGSVDYDTEIVAVGQTAYTAATSPLIKQWKMVRPIVTTSGSSVPEVGVSVDFQETDSLATTGEATAATARFDTAVFDTAVFSADTNNVSEWVGVTGIGVFGSIKFRGETGETGTGSALWGSAVWGSSGWGAVSAAEEVVRVNGFMVMTEVGGHL